MQKQKIYYKSELGLLEIIATQTSICAVNFVDEDTYKLDQLTTVSDIDCVNECIKQLKEYFLEKRKDFSLPLALEGTEFQQRVWQELLKIPFGETISYLQLSERLGNKKAIRAVGRANGRNPVAIIVPCHRVIGSDGSLTGYAGGLWRKEWLLKHEGLRQATLW